MPREPARRRRRATSRRPKAGPCGEIIKAADSHSELVVSPAALAFYKGENRYPFGVFERDRSQVDDAEVALYVAKVPHAEAGREAKPGTARARARWPEAARKRSNSPRSGPSRRRSKASRPSRPSGPRRRPSDPDAATRRLLDRHRLPQRRRVADRGADQGRRRNHRDAAAERRRSANSRAIPRPGQQAPKIHTPTAEDVGGDLSKITTRIPPDTQNRVDYAEALGKEPILLLFATPQFCQSRVCGPVVDVAEQVKQEYGDKAAFIHMEIYNDNDPEQGRAAAGAGVPPAERAVAVRDQPQGRDQLGGRGRLRRRTDGRSRGRR